MCDDCSRPRCAGRIHPIGARRFVRLANTRLQICRERVEELARRLGFEQSRSYRVIFYQSHERADANKIIVHEPFRHADHKSYDNR